MGFQDIKQLSTWLSVQRSRARVRGLVLLVIIPCTLVAFVALAIWLGAFTRDVPPPRPAGELSLSFGFGREPVSRSITLNLKPANRADGETTEETLAVRLASDLRRGGRSAEFPAEQISVGVTRLSPTQVNLTVTANPWTPEKIAPGLYTGTLELRGDTFSKTVPISVWLRSRESTWAAVAFMLLTSGAALGLIVKWITERLTPQAALIRRLASLEQTIGFQEDAPTLPVRIRLQLKRLEDEIEREDYAAAEASFKKLEPQAEQLAGLSSQFAILLDQISGQARFIEEKLASPGGGLKTGEVDTLLLKAVLDSEYRAVQTLLANTWEEPQQNTALAALQDSVRGLYLSFGHIFNYIEEHLDSPWRPAPRDALAAAQAGHLDENNLTDIYDKAAKGPQPTPPPMSEEAVDSSQPAKRRYGTSFTVPFIHNERAREDRARIKFQFRWARTLAGIGSILIVSLAGLKLQYLDEQGFNGSLSAWIGLLLWAAVVELSGVSVLDVLGRLGTSGARVRATA